MKGKNYSMKTNAIQSGAMFQVILLASAIPQSISDDRQPPSAAVAYPREAPRHPVLTRALLAMEANLCNAEYSVEGLCRQVGVSYASLNRKLRALTGRSAIQLLRQLRLQKAKMLLRQPSLSISDVAYDSGFTDPSYFSRVFTREEGMTPTAYRMR